MDRLTAEDLLMLWPDEIWPQEIGALAVLDASSLLDQDGRFRIEAVREVVAARLPGPDGPFCPAGKEQGRVRGPLPPKPGGGRPARQGRGSHARGR